LFRRNTEPLNGLANLRGEMVDLVLFSGLIFLDWACNLSRKLAAYFVSLISVIAFSGVSFNDDGF
jgi:hypothetical protein